VLYQAAATSSASEGSEPSFHRSFTPSATRSKAKSLVPPHPTLGDVDSPQALIDYQAAKRAHKAEWKKMQG
jgi:hypothetical protein